MSMPQLMNTKASKHTHENAPIFEDIYNTNLDATNQRLKDRRGKKMEQPLQNRDESSWIPVTPAKRIPSKKRGKNDIDVNQYPQKRPNTAYATTSSTRKPILKLRNNERANIMKPNRKPQIYLVEGVDNDNDKVKWWEKEIGLFEERARSFISTMRNFQGDRHFVAWKGSVVDSVVGAFLTQNVRDQESSSAFMSLVAQFQNTEMQQACDDNYINNRKQTESGSTLKDQVNSFGVAFSETEANKAFSRGKQKNDQKHDEEIDWDRLRILYSKGRQREKSINTIDSVDWEAVRQANVEAISEIIKKRGMNNKLAEKIKDFLNRMVRDHKSIDLEWLKNAPPDMVKKYLLSITGMGLKSTECVRLLTLQQLAFPVDTNVARIVVRLGWVPIQPFDETFLLHKLDEYPKENTIQEYLWPRLCTLDEETLYELHYQIITFGKGFCTKIKPNCKACPLRGECSHFASACASGRLKLPRSGKKSIAAKSPVAPQARDIEDLVLKAPNRILTTKLSAEEPNALTPKVLRHPKPRLTYESQSRIKHKVYVLPDSHHLLEGRDPREPDDSCPYLLAIWISGETSNFVQQPNFQTNGNDGKNPHTVLGTILIPCRTAMRGRFPLNGTYFQVNEVFADDESSEHPIDVSAHSITGLDMKTLYCGTSLSLIVQDLAAKEIEDCFQTGFICVRGYNSKTRVPGRLPQRFLPRAYKKKRKNKHWKENFT